ANTPTRWEDPFGLTGEAEFAKWKSTWRYHGWVRGRISKDQVQAWTCQWVAVEVNAYKTDFFEMSLYEFQQMLGKVSEHYASRGIGVWWHVYDISVRGNYLGWHPGLGPVSESAFLDYSNAADIPFSYITDLTLDGPTAADPEMNQGQA